MIKVLVIDDSAVVRKVITEELAVYEDIEIVGTAIDPYIARDKIVKLRPDVITLDLEMPRMDGLSFLAKLMKYHPMPVVILSSLATQDSDTVLQALRLGAVEVLCKPGGPYGATDVSQRLVRAIRSAASARMNKSPLALTPAVEKSGINYRPGNPSHKVIAIGASTGGTQALQLVLENMPAGTPGMLIVQHMPENFTGSFAERLNQLSAMEVREACDGDTVVPGLALIAPGNRHMLLRRNGSDYQVQLKDGPRVHYHRPSVDVLFQSVARSAGSDAVGVLLTGMGADGAKGLLAMKENGARTLAQDEKTSVVFGMPKEAIKLSAVDEIVSLPELPGTLTHILKQETEKCSVV